MLTVTAHCFITTWILSESAIRVGARNKPKLKQLLVYSTCRNTDIAGRAAGIIIGMPPSHNTTAQAAISSLLAVVKSKQVIGLYESYGGDDEPIDTLRRKFLEHGVKEGFEAIRIKEEPKNDLFRAADEAGHELGQLLVRERTIKHLKTIDADLD